MNTDVKFQNVEVPMVGEDGNPFFIISRVSRALHKGGATPHQIAEFQSEAMSGDYDHVLQTVMKWVNIY